MKISNIANLPTRFGTFKIQSFSENDKDHLAIFFGDLTGVVNLRVHSECLTGDALGSLKCDCGAQLNAALEYIAKNGGLLIYLRQEGRNIGLFNKVNAYALQDTGLDTVEANHALGFGADERTYEVAEEILRFYGITKVNLLSNNQAKLASLKEVVSRTPLIVGKNKFNEDYFRVKKEQMGHLL